MSQRKLFEEVGETPAAQRPQAATGAISRGQHQPSLGLRLWLFVLFVMVAAMIIIGGLTRLEGGGLSVAQWSALKSALPPASPQAWQDAYATYLAIPELRPQGDNLDLDAFRQAYWWEWGHRLLGWMFILVWLVGLVVFWSGRRIPPGWGGRLVAIGVLGGAQGVVGWWMGAAVLSGRMADISSYRLAVQFGFAFSLLGMIAWYLLGLARSEAERMRARRGAERGFRRLAGALLGLAFVQILLGALMAGIDAGRTFGDWPLMAGRFFPDGAFDLTPPWRNFFENPALVQFMHRIAAYVFAAFALWAWLRARHSPNPATRNAFGLVAIMVLLEGALGVVSLIYGAPIYGVVTHQVGAIFTWVLIVLARHQAAYPVTQSIRG